MPNPKTRVLVIDDSALVRRILTESLSRDPDIEVVGAATDPYAAKDKINELKPDVLTLDVEMPRMHGLAFLKILMEQRPMPVVMVSSLTDRGAEETLQALELGAVDFVTKPKLDVSQGLGGLMPELVEKVKAAARCRLSKRVARPSQPTTQRVSASLGRTTHRVVAIGASTGGTEAVRQVLAELPADCPGTLIVQHMPEQFTKAFAKRLDGISALSVSEAQHGDQVLPGRVLIAPGNYHMRLVREGAKYVVAIDQEKPVSHHRPSVDVLFESVAEAAGRNAVGVILTGMGDDGARGLLRMREAGAHTIAQDKDSCVVFGMPREAIERGAACQVVPLDQVSQAVLSKL